MLHNEVPMNSWFYYKGINPRSRDISELYLIHILEKIEHGISGDLYYFDKLNEKYMGPIYITNNQWDGDYYLETPLNNIAILKLLLKGQYDYRNRQLFYDLSKIIT
jgi:hypothetical protein